MEVFEEIVGIVLTNVAVSLVIGILVSLLNIIANWKILSKAGIGGWQSIIPVWNNIARYGVSWSKWIGFLVSVVCPVFLALFAYRDSNPIWLQIVLSIVCLFMLACMIIEKFKLAKVYGYGFFFGIGLLILEPIFILILGFGKSTYIGKD